MSQSPASELSEVIGAISLILNGVDEAKADDGRVSLNESLMIFASALPALVRGFSGIRGIPAELVAMDQETMDELYFGFLKDLQWNPDDDTRDKFSIAYDVASAIIIGGLKWRNTVTPPKPQIIP